MTGPTAEHWAIPVVCPGFHADDPVRWFLVPFGSDAPVTGCGWPDRESAERHGAESGLVIHKEGEVEP